MSNPDRIWLAPECHENTAEGRTWAAPAPDPACEACDLPWVEYLRADLVSTPPPPERLAAVAMPGREEIEWLRDEFESLSYATEGEFACSDMDSASYRADRERASRIFAALLAPPGDGGEVK